MVECSSCSSLTVSSPVCLGFADFLVFLVNCKNCKQYGFLSFHNIPCIKNFVVQRGTSSTASLQIMQKYMLCVFKGKIGHHQDDKYKLHPSANNVTSNSAGLAAAWNTIVVH